MGMEWSGSGGVGWCWTVLNSGGLPKVLNTTCVTRGNDHCVVIPLVRQLVGWNHVS